MHSVRIKNPVAYLLMKLFLLFVIGLELSIERLWSMRRLVFGLGSLQILVTGAAIGAIAGGGKGAAIGAGVGGATGAGAVLATRGEEAELASETRLTFRLKNPITITEKLD